MFRGGRFLQLSRGRFAAAAAIGQGKTLRCFRVQTNQHLQTLGGADGETCTFIPVTKPLARCVWQQRRVAAGEVILRGTGIGYDACTEPGVAVTALLVSASQLAEASAALTGQELQTDLSGWHTLQVTPGKIQRVLDAADSFLTSSGAAEEDASIAEDICLRRLVASLSGCPTEVMPPARRAVIARKAIDLMQSVVDRPLSSLELCREVQANDRTLRLAFQERFDLGPIAYHRLLRLHAVRDTLKQGCVARVGDAAIANGFKRLGSFAAEYRVHFGERPSATHAGCFAGL